MNFEPKKFFLKGYFDMWRLVEITHSCNRPPPPALVSKMSKKSTRPTSTCQERNLTERNFLGLKFVYVKAPSK